MKWIELDKFLKSSNREIVHIPGDGFCFINVVLTAMKQDHGLELTEKEAIQLVLEKVLVPSPVWPNG